MTNHNSPPQSQPTPITLLSDLRLVVKNRRDVLDLCIAYADTRKRALLADAALLILSSLLAVVGSITLGRLFAPSQANSERGKLLVFLDVLLILLAGSCKWGSVQWTKDADILLSAIGHCVDTPATSTAETDPTSTANGKTQS